jgi:predicted Na+-dependent transporter
MSDNIKQFILVLVVVFVSAAGTQFLANAVDVFASDWSTWAIILNSGIVAVVTYVVAYLTPQNRAFGIGSGDRK